MGKYQELKDKTETHIATINRLILLGPHIDSFGDLAENQNDGKKIKKT